MHIDELRKEIIKILEVYEDKVRHYCSKVEIDRPWVADALWDATWNFRLALLADINYYKLTMSKARYTKDPG